MLSSFGYGANVRVRLGYRARLKTHTLSMAESASPLSSSATRSGWTGSGWTGSAVVAGGTVVTGCVGTDVVAAGTSEGGLLVDMVAEY